MKASNFAKATLAIFFFSIILNAQWFQQNSGVTSQLYSVYFIDQNTGFAAGNGGNILRTTNAGSNWVSNTILDTSITYNSIYFINQLSGYATGRILRLTGNNEIKPEIIKTTNAGLNWFSILNDTAFTLKSIYFLNVNTGFATGGLFTASTNYLLTTTNAGLNWQKTSPGVGYLWPIAFKDANTGFISCFYGYIYRTTNSGINWSLFYSLPNDFLPALTFIDANTGFTAGGNSITSDSAGHIYKTINGGSNWNLVYSDHKGNINDVIFVNSNTGFAVGTYDAFLSQDTVPGRILKTINSGNSWFIDSLFTNFNGFTSLFFTDANTGYVVGNNGVILKTTTGGNLLGITPISNDVPEHFSLSQNYPNPFNPTTTIKFDIPRESDVKIAVYDILGNEIQSLVNENMKAGEYKVTWDASNFSSGIYFYKITSRDFVESKKMLLIK